MFFILPDDDEGNSLPDLVDADEIDDEIDDDDGLWLPAHRVPGLVAVGVPACQPA